MWCSAFRILLLLPASLDAKLFAGTLLFAHLTKRSVTAGQAIQSQYTRRPVIAELGGRVAALQNNEAILKMTNVHSPIREMDDEEPESI